MERNCIVCGNPLPAIRRAHPRALTCSDECSDERTAERNRANVRRFRARQKEAMAS